MLEELTAFIFKKVLCQTQANSFQNGRKKYQNHLQILSKANMFLNSNVICKHSFFHSTLKCKMEMIQQQRAKMQLQVKNSPESTQSMKDGV
jgi:hypothetical protein